MAAVQKPLIEPGPPPITGTIWARVVLTLHPSGTPRHVLSIPLTKEAAIPLNWQPPKARANSMTESVSIRPAKFSQGKTRPVLQEVYSFGERASQAERKARRLSDVDPLVLLGTDRLGQCDESFVAECDGRIAGAVTLAYNGVYNPKRPTLDALYVLPDFQRQGIGLALLLTAVRRFVELGRTPVLCKVESAEMRALLERLGERHPDLRQQIDARFEC